MKQVKNFLSIILIAVFAINFCWIPPVSAAQVDTYDLYANQTVETAILDGVAYEFHLYYQDGCRTIAVSNNRDDSIDIVQYNPETELLTINGQIHSSTMKQIRNESSISPAADPGWEVKTSGTYYISWAQGTTAAVVAAAIATYLGTLGTAGVIAAMGTAALGALAASCSGGTLYMEYQVLAMTGVNQQRWMWTFTASTGDFYGPFYDYVVV